MIVIAGLAAAAALNCSDPVAQAEMTQCAALDYQRADAALNQQWRATLAVMQAADRGVDRSYDKRPGYVAALLESQRAWLKFRDTECVVEGYLMRGGSAEPMVVAGCKAELTKERVKQLRSLAENN